MPDDDDLAPEWTGERFIPGEGGAAIDYEHRHRYLLAQRLARGKRVVDLACGEGYGSALLAETATSVLGVDIEPIAVHHAQSKYAQGNLTYDVADIRDTGLPDKSCDFVVCFEAIEHVPDPERVVKEAHRLLEDGGVFLVSTPDKRTYSDARNFDNHFHEHEFYRGDFEDLLEQSFDRVTLLGQRVVTVSAIWPDDEKPSTPTLLTPDGRDAAERAFGSVIEPLYFVAVCEKGEAKVDELDDRRNWLLLDPEDAFGVEHDRLMATSSRIEEFEVHERVLQAAKADAEARFAVAERRRGIAEAQLADIESSHSWRMTKPLRALTRRMAWRHRAS